MRAYVIFVAGDNDPLHRRWLAELEGVLAGKGAIVHDSFVSPNRNHLDGTLEQMATEAKIDQVFG
jgi:hypothetical protein